METKWGDQIVESKVRVTIYLTPAEKLILQRLAQQHLRSMTSEVRAILVEKLKQEEKWYYENPVS